MAPDIPEINMFTLPDDHTEINTESVKPVTVTVNNVTELNPVVLYVSLANEYDQLSLPAAVETIDDMNEISKLISYCANSKAYLNSLLVYLDIATRIEKRKGKDAKTAYDDMVCRKNIVSSYFDTIDGISKAGSRMVTIFLEAKKAEQEENALAKAAIQKNRT